MMEAAGPWPAEIDMGVTEIVLIILGIAVFAASFLVPDKYAKQEDGIIKEQEKKLKLFLQRELQTIRIGIEEKVEESMVSSGEKSERYMERITNEKIMAIQEYSDTVLEQIHKNHEEAVFLYDMLNNKHDQIKYTAGEISSAVEEARQKLEITVQDVTRDLLRGSIRDSLIEKIGNMLQETVQEAIDTSIKEDLQDRIEKTVQKEVELAVSENLMRAIKEAVEISIEESIREREQKGPLISGIEVLANKQQEKEEKEDLTERKKEDSKDIAEKLVTEAGEQEFQELALGIPEVIMEEEQPFVVQPVKKVSPKKKAPAKKGGARAKTTINSEGNKDIPAGKEEAGSNNKEKILKLHREGMSNMAIARELGLGNGEVQLVIGLFEGM
ncbi:MAG: DUF6115 domain-containing protein [Lachnospiraceae bacterium]|nr:DUF6115 domain-containing protein [Lachnospiraceae bacterium]